MVYHNFGFVLVAPAFVYNIVFTKVNAKISEYDSIAKNRFQSHREPGAGLERRHGVFSPCSTGINRLHPGVNFFNCVWV